MTEKVIFEFRTIDDKESKKYEIRQGGETYTCSSQKINRCLPLMFFPHPRIFTKMHRKAYRHAQKRARTTLNALESLYADFYGSGMNTMGKDDHE